MHDVFFSTLLFEPNYFTFNDIHGYPLFPSLKCPTYEFISLNSLDNCNGLLPEVFKKFRSVGLPRCDIA